MEWHFGYNCKFFLPMRVRKAADDDLQVCDPRDAENREHNGQRPFQKCRRLINAYRLRSDLIEQRWLNTAELFVYLNLSNDELLRQIAAGEIIARIKKNGKVQYSVQTAWQFDDCYLASSGGQCLNFEQHSGWTISCLDDLRGLDTAEHPNLVLTPSDANLSAFEAQFISLAGNR